MQFQVETPRKNDSREIIADFLGSIDAAQLSSEVLDSMGWGTGGDPVEKAIAILRQRVASW